MIDQTDSVEGFDRYIQAIHAGHSGNHLPMQVLFKEILAVSAQEMF